jgi:hypothetical protein
MSVHGAVRRLVQSSFHRDDYSSEWAVITAVSKRLGMNVETLRESLTLRGPAQIPNTGASDNQSHNVAAVRIEPFRLPGRVTGGRVTGGRNRKWTPNGGGTPHSPQARPSHPFIVRTRP